jgi:putative addiction module component
VPLVVARIVVARIEIHTCYPSALDAKQLLAEALRLSDEERAALAGELIQSLDHDVDPDAEAAWSEEIRARHRSRRSARSAPKRPLAGAKAARGSFMIVRRKRAEVRDVRPSSA